REGGQSRRNHRSGPFGGDHRRAGEAPRRPAVEPEHDDHGGLDRAGDDDRGVLHFDAGLPGAEVGAQGLHGGRRGGVLDVPVDRGDGDRAGRLVVADGERHAHLGVEPCRVDLDAAQLHGADERQLGRRGGGGLELGPGIVSGLVERLRAGRRGALLGDDGRDGRLDLVGVDALLQFQAQTRTAVGRGRVEGVADAGDLPNPGEQLLAVGLGALGVGGRRRRRLEQRLARDRRGSGRHLLGARPVARRRRHRGNTRRRRLRLVRGAARTRVGSRLGHRLRGAGSLLGALGGRRGRSRRRRRGRVALEVRRAGDGRGRRGTELLARRGAVFGVRRRVELGIRARSRPEALVRALLLSAEVVIRTGRRAELLVRTRLDAELLVRTWRRAELLVRNWRRERRLGQRRLVLRIGRDRFELLPRRRAPRRRHQRAGLGGLHGHPRHLPGRLLRIAVAPAPVRIEAVLLLLCGRLLRPLLSLGRGLLRGPPGPANASASRLLVPRWTLRLFRSVLVVYH